MIAKLMVKSLNTLEAVKNVSREEEGAALVEYGLLVGLIAVVVVGAVTTLGTTLLGYFNTINGAL